MELSGTKRNVKGSFPDVNRRSSGVIGQLLSIWATVKVSLSSHNHAPLPWTNSMQSGELHSTEHGFEGYDLLGPNYWNCSEHLCVAAFAH